ncbi:hypothetical protein KR100_00145 [Synechococcus sp. KORDI-100]|nr:hypothetical protein KR100_00145 [Synechococcus sp. KORDI-100]
MNVRLAGDEANVRPSEDERIDEGPKGALDRPVRPMVDCRVSTRVLEAPCHRLADVNPQVV